MQTMQQKRSEGLVCSDKIGTGKPCLRGSAVQNLACAAHGYADGAPILDLRTAEAELAAHLAEEGGVEAG